MDSETLHSWLGSWASDFTKHEDPLVVGFRQSVQLLKHIIWGYINTTLVCHSHVFDDTQFLRKVLEVCYPSVPTPTTQYEHC